MSDKIKMRLGKIIYIPPEKCFSRIKIEETAHGFRLYRDGETRPFKVIPFSAMKQIEYFE